MSYWNNLFDAIVGKSYAKEIEKPLDVNRGASWQSAGGVRPTFDQGSALLAYGVHAYTNAAVTRISSDLAALPLKLFKGRGSSKVQIENHPVLELMENPSSDMSGYLLRAQLITDLLLSGNCYILILGQSDNKPTSLIRLHPDETKIVTDQKKGLIGYEHSSSGSVVLYPPERVLHGKNISYAKGAQQVYGCGATEALSREIDADLNSQKLASEASSKGRPDILIYPKEDGDIWPAELRRQILDNYTGMAKQGGAMILSGQCEVRELKLSPREMEFEASRRMARESISALLGCPPTVLGLPAANFATAKQQNITYWQNQIKKARQMAGLFSKVAHLFDPSIYFEHDFSGVEALQETRNLQLQRIEKHILNGIDPRAAYAAEGMEFPILKSEPEEDIDIESRIWLRSIEDSIEIKETDYGKKSNAKAAMEALPEATQKALKKKASEHNEEYGDNPKKKLTNRNYLAVSYHRGLAAYSGNPESVRPNVQSPQQWGMARVNGLLYALRTGKFRRKPYDTDLLPPDHPNSNAEKKHLLSGYKRLPTAPKDEAWGFTDEEADKIFAEGGMELYRRAFLFVDKGGSSDRSSYRLPIAKLIDGELKIVFRGVIAAGSSLRKEPKFRSGFYNISGASDSDIVRMYEIIKDFYEDFGEEAPQAEWEEKNFIEQLQDIQISTEPSNPREQSLKEIQDSILGEPPNWERYARAHVLVNPQRQQDREGYLLLIARREDSNDPNNAAPETGELKIYTDLLARSVDLLNGTEGRLPITEEERRAAYKTINQHFDKTDLIPDPLLPVYLTNFNVKKEITNFPNRGEDKEISFENSEYRMFDPDYAEDLKKNYPEIWKAGGNIRGNSQYRKLKPITGRSKRVAKTESEKDALKLREAWIARHRTNGDQFNDKDHPITLSSVAGIVAQIKWFAVGDIGQTRMKEVLDTLKRKLEKKGFVHSGHWEDFIAKTHSPAERELERISRSYLREAASRYAERAVESMSKYFNGNIQTRAVLDWSQLYSIDEEKIAFKQKFGIYWKTLWSNSGKKAASDVFKKAKKPDGFSLKDTGGEQDLLDQAATQVVTARAARVGKIVQQGLIEGLGTAEIAAGIEAAGLFGASAARAIARTEATRIINRATIDAYKQMNEAGLNVKKQWLTAGDEKVRDVHAELNMQIVGVDESFDSSAGEVFQPAEFGEASLDVNCRCTLIPYIE